MSTHTPGPWVYGVRKDGSIWLSIGDHTTGPHYQGDLCASEADARLIAAAPEMLDLLKHMYHADTASKSHMYLMASLISRATGSDV